MTNMRAKMRIVKVERHDGGSDALTMRAVGRNTSYPADGGDENNTFAKFTPCAELTMSITNPDLLGKFEPGDEYYLDFSLAPKAEK